MKILLACVENAGRSQMAEALTRRRGIVASAGTLPAPSVNPVVVQVMRERGIDLSTNQPKMLTTKW